MKKMDKKWIILCSTAIAAVYSAGYITTESQAVISQPSHHAAENTPMNKYALNNSNVKTGKTNTAVSVKDPSNSAGVSNTQKSSRYKEGTFTGTGMNRRGSMDVQVTLKNDRITDVEIRNYGMHYSESDIVGLPNEVVKNQSAQVMNVSGATYSTQAFTDAIQKALYQAQNKVG
jgi:uncharacterized protein with FMN-binding domain